MKSHVVHVSLLRQAHHIPEESSGSYDPTHRQGRHLETVRFEFINVNYEESFSVEEEFIERQLTEY